MDMSTKTNFTEIIEINVQWKTAFVFSLAAVLKIYLKSLIRIRSPLFLLVSYARLKVVFILK